MSHRSAAPRGVFIFAVAAALALAAGVLAIALIASPAAAQSKSKIKQATFNTGVAIDGFTARGGRVEFRGRVSCKGKKCLNKRGKPKPIATACARARTVRLRQTDEGIAAGSARTSSSGLWRLVFNASAVPPGNFRAIAPKKVVLTKRKGKVVRRTVCKRGRSAVFSTSSSAAATELAKKKGGKAKKRQRKQRQRARRLIANGQYVGTRGDGRTIDHTLCANGKYELKTGTATSVGVSTGRGWRVTKANFKKRRMTAIVKARGTNGPEFAIRKRRQQWQIGYVSFGKPAQFGPVERSGAKAACATLEVD